MTNGDTRAHQWPTERPTCGHHHLWDDPDTPTCVLPLNHPAGHSYVSTTADTTTEPPGHGDHR